MKDKCSKCDNLLETNRINKQRYCKACHNKWMRSKRPKHSQLTDKQRLKVNCRAYLNTYLRRGKIVKGSCIHCSNPDTEAHHSDYTQPLLVIWVCRACHITHYHS